jgi:hypothetical protein
MASMSDGEESIPAITRAGSPGITRMTTKTMVEISNTVKIKRPNFFRAKRAMDIHLYVF